MFEPHSATLPDVREYLKALWDRRQFMHELASSDLRTERSGKVLGNLTRASVPMATRSLCSDSIGVLLLSLEEKNADELIQASLGLLINLVAEPACRAEFIRKQGLH